MQLRTVICVTALVLVALSALGNDRREGEAFAAKPAPPLPVMHPRRLTAIAPPAANPRRAPGAAATNPVAAGAVAGSPSGAPTPAVLATTKAATQPGMPPLPARKPGSKRSDTPEGRFLDRLDSAIAPLRAYDISSDDRRALVNALIAIKAGKLRTGNSERAKITDKVAVKLVDWYRLRAGFGRPAEFKTFIADNPAWPAGNVMTRRAEEQLFIAGGDASKAGGDASKIKSYFEDRRPDTAAGYGALASAYLAEGDQERAREFAGRAWRDLDLQRTLEKGFLKRFGALLSQADHKWRLDRILLGSGRARMRRAAARRMVKLLTAASERKKAQARIAVHSRSKAAARLMAAQAPQPEPDWGLEFQRAQLLRRQKKHDQAWKILLAAPKDAGRLVRPDAWWRERRLGIAEALGAGKSKIAYQLAADPGDLSVNPRNASAFLAGWLALRHLGEPKAASLHFKAMRGSADGPLSASKAAYWLARALEAAGDKAAAATSYADAAARTHTFHGQLARQALDPATTQLSIQSPSAPTRDKIERFNAMDAIKAAVIASKAGLKRSMVRAVFNHLRYHLKDEADRIMLAHLARSMGDTQMSLRIGKTGVANGQNLYYYAYPVHALPVYIPLRKPPETAFLMAIARQESEFNGQIKSRAGARGILQVMPITARHICRNFKIKCRIGRLITDQSYNTMIASAYIADRTDEFSGSYVLTLTGYNAGPGRTRQWLRRYGDPRAAGADVLDWIEGLPFNETRSYVMKVLSNVQVYRARLGDQANALQLGADLVRAKAMPSGARLVPTQLQIGTPGN